MPGSKSLLELQGYQSQQGAAELPVISAKVRPCGYQGRRLRREQSPRSGVWAALKWTKRPPPALAPPVRWRWTPCAQEIGRWSHERREYQPLDSILMSTSNWPGRCIVCVSAS